MSANGIDGWYRASNARATFAFRVEGGEVVECAPYGRKIIMGLRWATAYMKLEQGNFEVARMLSDAPPETTAAFERSLVRRALDYLLDAYPMFDLVSIDWQVGDPLGRLGSNVVEHTGRWVLVELGQPSEAWDETPAWAMRGFAIFKNTGALHSMEGGVYRAGRWSYGAVSDDPIWTP